jgi:hypothetical protein
MFLYKTVLIKYILEGKRPLDRQIGLEGMESEQGPVLWAAVNKEMNAGVL